MIGTSILIGLLLMIAFFWGLVHKPEGHPERKKDDEAQMKFLRELAEKETEKCAK